MLATQFIVEGAKRREPGIYVTLEEGMGEVISAAKRLALPLDEAIHDGLAEVLYLSREHALASQFLSLLVDKIRAQKARRLVLDSLTHLVPNGLDEAALRQLLFALVGRFKALGVTSLFTMESTSMFSREKITDRAFSPIADNLIVLRYAELLGGIRPTLTVVKTRGTRHDFGTYYYDFGAGGIHLGPRADGADAERAGEMPRAERLEDAPAKPEPQPRARRRRPRR